MSLNGNKKQEIWARDKFICGYCGLDCAKDPKQLSVDHIIPLSKGGTNEEKNLLTACKRCNWEKADRVKRYPIIKMAYEKL